MQGGGLLRTLQDPKKIEEVGYYFLRLHELYIDYYHYWLKNTFLKWDFWTSVALSIIPWFIWFKVRKKESSSRLLYGGLTICTFSYILDFIGVELGLWYYTGKSTPNFSSFFPWDFTLIPVFTMLLIQWRPTISPYWKALIFTGVSSFLAEPFFQWLGFYVMLNWHHLYSFPINYVLFLIAYKQTQSRSFAELSK